MQSMQVAYRAMVMIGTLVVGALAYRAYGPQLEKLQPVVERVQQLAAETWWPKGSTPEVALDAAHPSPPSEFTTPAMPLAPVESPPRFDDNLQPAVARQFPAPPSGAPAAGLGSPAATPVATIVRRLNDLGVTEYSLNKWGSTGELYRFHCSAPWGHQGHYSRHFEAIAANPADAARGVLEQIERVPIGNGAPPPAAALPSYPGGTP